jgi:hypothetical protein
MEKVSEYNHEKNFFQLIARIKSVSHSGVPIEQPGNRSLTARGDSLPGHYS